LVRTSSAQSPTTKIFSPGKIFFFRCRLAAKKFPPKHPPGEQHVCLRRVHTHTHTHTHILGPHQDMSPHGAVYSQVKVPTGIEVQEHTHTRSPTHIKSRTYNNSICSGGFNLPNKTRLCSEKKKTKPSLPPPHSTFIIPPLISRCQCGICLQQNGGLELLI